MRDPQVFLFDEPLSNLDAKLRVQMRAEIKELHQRLKTTTIYVTHDQIEAMTMADRIVVMRDGVVEQIGRSARSLRPAGEPVRRGLHRLAVDEPAQGQGHHQRQAGFRHRRRRRLCRSKSAPPDTDGRPCIYGVRPEHLGRSAADFEAEVSVVEPTGSETQVFAKVGGHQIVAVFRDRVSAKPGETLLLSPNLDAVHLFDAESGKRLE